MDWDGFFPNEIYEIMIYAEEELEWMFDEGFFKTLQHVGIDMR